ncbi:asparagine synthase (glutamine-hydrolyzing) [Mobilitalea sibirica]|uniref:asparagine synthase (glutamine-hydrolyzing) n=1 Tax=Mobilitalea sibirica TaxID=1462919 RepID=A0A8J7HAX6_9FIRM|nr:asparagine synthase (glutamine-hydrolyzing) [Mobilitalea sibirica]MBH1939352.1 asparagine synthase (glutamine-hydrolyzing) [Mobilitalea sibirica]
MCGIAGFSNMKADFTKDYNKWHKTLTGMKHSMKHRGPDDEGIVLYPQAGLAHTRLSIIDLTRGHQPMTKSKFGCTYSIVYNGELYNTVQLRDNLVRMGYLFKTHSDTEVILTGYMAFGESFVKELNGIFSFAIWDDNKHSLFLCRDRLGVKPLFYTVTENTIVFSSEIKTLFKYPGFTPRIDSRGLCEIFALGPAKTYGLGVFKDVYEVLPGHFIQFNKNGFHDETYWELVSAPHEDTYDETVERTSFLLYDSIKRQMVSDIPICTFLSGGVDSSLITAICAEELKKEGKRIESYSFDFVDNAKHFKSNSFQPSMDRPYVDIMVEHVNSRHTYLECNNDDMIENLFHAVDARDLPNMADVESSLLYFCKKVAKRNKVTLTGECADEIFGGYPWFHSQEAMELNTFPWSKNLKPRKQLLSEDLLATIDLDEYVRNTYKKSVAETPHLDGESKLEARRREIAYLNLKWFMMTLLDRMDRCSMYSGLEARVPMADHRIVEYIWNVPWEMKCPNGVVKGLLRDAGKGLIPDEILYRKKSPYPKTYHPEYEKRLGNMLLEVLSDSNAPIRPLIDAKKVRSFLTTPSDYGKPWYGQLMAGPQMIAYMLQVNYWLGKYKIELV